MTSTELPTPVSSADLATLAARVPVPAYDRAAVSVGIVHLGVGGFHRAHQAVYVDDVLAAGDLSWGICGVGVLPADRALHEALAAQDCLYTLVLKHPDGRREARVIGSVVELMLAPDDPDAVVEKMALPETKIVSLTVTEGGYHVLPATGELDSADPGLQHDLQPGAQPVTAFGLIVEALLRRRARGVPPFTVMSCDNIPGNGDLARRMISSFARLRDPELGDWVEQAVSFPNSMVDRITPVTAATDREQLVAGSGIVDRWPVVCEPYLQWVLEDDFPLGRPPWDDAGVQMVDDVVPYELMKLRLLNAGHQALAYLGHLSGHRYAHEVCQDPLFVDFLLGYMDEEAAPTLPPVPGVDLHQYARTLIERFANPHVQDTLARLCAYTSDRIPVFLLPVVRAQLEVGGPITRSALTVAAWTRYAEGTDEQGQPIDVVDRLQQDLHDRAVRSREDPLAFISHPGLFGTLADDERFTTAYTQALGSLRERGAHATVEALP